METETIVKQPIFEKETAKNLPPLPFAYQRTDNESLAKSIQYRALPMILDGEKIESLSDDEILESVKAEKEAKCWHTSEYWRKKGMPDEQVDFLVNYLPITFYNYNKEKPLADEHIIKTQFILSEMSAKFPKLIDHLHYILGNDEQVPSIYGDNEKFPASGMAQAKWHSVQLFPRGMEDFPHRINSVGNFEGTLVHELTHLIEGEFTTEWLQKFQWLDCIDNPQMCEWKKTPDGGSSRWFNKETGEMTTQGKFPREPEQCITDYAKNSVYEDICDSMVAYILDPEKLRSISPDKYAIFARHDAKLEKPEVVTRRIAKDQIKLPEVKSETVLYFVHEPEEKS